MENSITYDYNRFKRLITDIEVVNTKLINIKGFMGSKYIVYAFKIITPYKSWFIKKRYSQVKIFIDFIQTKYPDLEIPPFPPKRLISTSKDTIIERKKKFHIIFKFVIEHVDLLKEKLITDFFGIDKIMIITYIKSFFMVNENINFEFSDSNGSFNSSASSMSSNNDENKLFKRNFFTSNNVKNNKNDNNDNKITTEVINNNKINIINNYMEEYFDISPKKLSKRKLFSLDNYFKTYEEYKLYTMKFNCRSQATFLIIKEFLRNLEIWNNVHIYEIINEFTDYMKYKKQWKKLNLKELKALYTGMDYEDLNEDYFKDFFTEKNPTKKFTSTFSENSIICTTPSSFKINENNSSTNSSINSQIKENETEIIKLHGILFYIGCFETNYLGAKSCLCFLNQLFDSSFNPEVEFYKNTFKKLDSKYIIQMNLDKFYKFNNYINKKICFNVLKIYVEDYDFEKQIKILERINFAEEIPEILEDEKILE